MITSSAVHGAVPWLVVLTLLLAGGGCAATAVEHDEVSHALPPHHPGSFSRAVAVLAAGRLDQAQRLDVLRWLPELAADTTLGRADWERVVAIAARLTAAAARDDADVAAAENVAELQGIVATLPPNERAVGEGGGEDETEASPAEEDASGEAAS